MMLASTLADSKIVSCGESRPAHRRSHLHEYEENRADKGSWESTDLGLNSAHIEARTRRVLSAT